MRWLLLVLLAGSAAAQPDYDVAFDVPHEAIAGATVWFNATVTRTCSTAGPPTDVRITYGVPSAWIVRGRDAATFPWQACPAEPSLVARIDQQVTVSAAGTYRIAAALHVDDGAPGAPPSQPATMPLQIVVREPAASAPPDEASVAAPAPAALLAFLVLFARRHRHESFAARHG